MKRGLPAIVAGIIVVGVVIGYGQQAGRTHDLRLTPQNVHWGHYDARVKPALRIAPADRVRVETMLAFVYLGVLPSFAAFLLWNRSILIFGPGRAALVYNTLPLHAIILSMVLLGERLMLYQVVGGLGIVAGVILGTTESSTSEEKNS